MAAQGMFSTTDIAPLLADRDVVLSAAQVYRLVVQTPERLSLRTLVALCDILDCTPTDLIEPIVETTQLRATGSGAAEVPAPVRGRRPRRAEIRPAPGPSRARPPAAGCGCAGSALPGASARTAAPSDPAEAVHAAGPPLA